MPLKFQLSSEERTRIATNFRVTIMINESGNNNNKMYNYYYCWLLLIILLNIYCSFDALFDRIAQKKQTQFIVITNIVERAE